MLSEGHHSASSNFFTSPIAANKSSQGANLGASGGGSSGGRKNAEGGGFEALTRDAVLAAVHDAGGGGVSRAALCEAFGARDKRRTGQLEALIDELEIDGEVFSNAAQLICPM